MTINHILRNKSQEDSTKENSQINDKFLHLDQERWQLPIYLKNNEKPVIRDNSENRLRNKSVKLPILKQKKVLLEKALKSNEEMVNSQLCDLQNIWRLKSQRADFEFVKSKKTICRGRIYLEPIRVDATLQI